MIKDKFTIREENESIILNAVIEHEKISRAKLSQVTGLNKASVSEIVKKLIEDGFIIETGIGESKKTGGRKPILLEFNERGSLVAAVDIGSDYINVGISYLDGTIITSSFRENLDIDKDNAFDYIVDELDSQMARVNISIVGLCVAIHGQVKDNEIIYTPAYNLHKSSLYEDLSKNYDFPIFFENEANLSALGEYVFGSKSEQLVCISIHSGIGAGFVSNGTIVEGSSGRLGEIGHTTLFPFGRECPCGNRGCLEQYASKSVLYEEIRKVKNMSNIQSEDVESLYRKGDQEVIKLINENVDYITIAINNTIMYYNPSVIVINGSYFRKIPELLDRINKNLTSVIADDVLIRNTSLNNNAILLGCIAYTVQKKLNITELKFKH